MQETVTLTSGQVISLEFYEKLMSVEGKRARFVIDTIIEKGSCSTEDIKDAGYEHAPRAKRDVVEAGIPIKNRYGKDRSGRRMAIYELGDWEEFKRNNSLARSWGRSILSDKLKNKLIEENGSKCALYNEEYPISLLQVDHRVPFEIAGDPEDMEDTSHFMLLSPSANRAKSWACEHCDNWIQKNIEQCNGCYYAFPESYHHVGGIEERRIDIIFKGEELATFNEIKKIADELQITIQEAIKMKFRKKIE